MDKIISSISIFCFLCFGSGCMQTPQEGQRASQYVPPAAMQMNAAGFATDYLADKIAVERNAWARTATGTVEVVAMLRNRTDFAQVIELQTMFFDANQMPLGQPSAWEKVFLASQAFGQYKCLSTDPEVAYFYIQIREAK